MVNDGLRGRLLLSKRKRLVMGDKIYILMAMNVKREEMGALNGQDMPLGIGRETVGEYILGRVVVEWHKFKDSL